MRYLLEIVFAVTMLTCVFGELVEECGLEAIASTPLVRAGLGGVKAKQFPWHVAIFHREKNNQFEQACGGSLVRSNLVISAAHCFSDRAHSHQVRVADYRIVGGVRLSSWNSTEIGRQQSEVREVRLGQEYGASIRNYQDDIAIIQLTTRFTFSDTVRVICLDLGDTDPYTSQTRPGTVGQVAGWGLTESGDPSDSLNFLGVPVVAREKCLDTLPYGYRSFFTSDKICAGLTNGTAVCQGDSGGGLVFPLQNISAGTQRWFLRGVLSNAPTSRSLIDPCLANFALYTNIYSHRAWLTTQVDENLSREDCKVRGSAGVCREYSACPRAIKEAARGILPQKCDQYSFGTEGQSICCSEPCRPLPKELLSQQRSGSKAADYCIELAEQIYPCQQTSTGWTRGDTCPAIPDPSIEYHQTKLNTTTEAPYLGRLGTGEEGDIIWRTAGVTLLSDRWLVTSARSIEVIGSGNITYVELGGEFNIYSPDVIYKVSKIIIHQEYNSTTSGVYNDIALVEVDRRITFTNRILPACLHTGTPLPYSGLILTGWDFTLKADVKTSMKLVPQEECAGIFTYKGLHPDGVRHQIEFCSRPINASGPCRGFGSGSPLSLYNGPRVACTHLLVGISSAYNGPTCTRVFTRVSGFIPWIESIVWA